MIVQRSIIITTLAVCLLCGAVGWIQHRDLQALQQRSRELEKTSSRNARLKSTDTLTAHQGQKETDTSEERGVGPAELARLFVEDLKKVDFQDRSENAEKQKMEFLGRLSAMDASSLQSLVDQLGAGDLPSDVTEGLSSMILMRLTEKGHGRLAADRILADALPPRAMVPVLRAWAAQDPAAASKWLEESRRQNRFPADDPDFESEAAKAIGSGLGAEAPIAALEQAAAAEGQARNSLLRGATEAIRTEQGWLDFARQAAASKDTQFRSQALIALSNGILRNDTFDDVRHLVDQLDLEPRLANPFITSAVTRKFDDQTAERADWMIERSSPEKVNDNVRQLMSLWTSNDFNGAAAWLQKLEPSTVRDVAVETFANKVVHREPESAIDWALTISDERKREATVIHLGRIWKSRDADAAGAYLSGQGIE